jgi:hypothetical protein
LGFVFVLLFVCCASSTFAEDDIDTEGPTKKPKSDNPFDKKPEPKPDSKTEPLTPNKVPEKIVAKGPCSQCLGTGYVPISALQIYVRAFGDAAKPEAAVPWKQCPKCQVGRDAKDLLDLETKRDAFELKKSMESKTSLKFSAVETRHVTLCGQDQPAELKDIADHLEKLTALLESSTNTTLLTPCRPDQDSIFILGDKGSYDTMLTKAFGQKSDSLAFKTGGSTGLHVSVSWPKAPPNGKPAPNVNKAVFIFASMLIQNSTNGKCPPWLREGFASHCENAILNSNLCYTIAYELNEVKFDKNWNTQLKKFAEERKLRPWSEIFPMDMISLGPLQYLTCYSMVSFLIRSDPKAFVKAVAMIRDGEISNVAIEKAYGRKIEDLQTAWGAWCIAQR